MEPNGEDELEPGINELEGLAREKMLLDYDIVPGVINYDLLKKALLQQLPEGILSKKIAYEEKFEECTKISIEFYNILRIDFLWIMPRLTCLSLANNLLDKIERLDSLVNLVELNLSFNKIKQIDNLQALNKLEILNLYGNLISKIENMDSLENLKIFSIGGNRIKSMECVMYLRNFENLKSLCLAEIPLEKKNKYLRETVAALFPQLVFYNYTLIRDVERLDGRVLNKKLIEEIEKKQREDELIRLEKEEKEKRNAYLRKAMIQGFDEHEFFESLLEKDDDCKAIRGLGKEVADVFNDFQERLFNFSNKIRKVGEHYLAKRQVEVEAFEFAKRVIEKQCTDAMDEVISELRMYRREWKKELLKTLKLPADCSFEVMINAVKEAKEIKFLFGDLVNQCWYKMMDLEMNRLSLAEDLNGKFELAVKEIVENQVEEFLGIFTDIRDVEVDFNATITEVMTAIIADYTARNVNLENLSRELKLMFTVKAYFQNAVLTSHDLHLLIIDNKEDEIMRQLQTWFNNTCGSLPKREDERNRDAIYSLNIFLDTQISYFHNMTKPLLKKCQELFNLCNEEIITNAMINKL